MPDEHGPWRLVPDQPHQVPQPGVGLVRLDGVSLDENGLVRAPGKEGFTQGIQAVAEGDRRHGPAQLRAQAAGQAQHIGGEVRAVFFTGNDHHS